MKQFCVGWESDLSTDILAVVNAETWQKLSFSKL
jgi:hypothetical protein